MDKLRMPNADLATAGLGIKPTARLRTMQPSCLECSPVAKLLQIAIRSGTRAELRRNQRHSGRL